MASIQQFMYVPLAGIPGSIPDVTAGATGTRLSATTVPCKVVVVGSLHGNTQGAYIRVADHGNAKAGQGTELAPGESCAFAVNDLMDLDVYGNGSDKVSVVYLM